MFTTTRPGPAVRRGSAVQWQVVKYQHLHQLNLVNCSSTIPNWGKPSKEEKEDTYLWINASLQWLCSICLTICHKTCKRRIYEPKLQAKVRVARRELAALWHIRTHLMYTQTPWPVFIGRVLHVLLSRPASLPGSRTSTTTRRHKTTPIIARRPAA